MNKYPKTSSLYLNFHKNGLDPIQQQLQKVNQFVSPQYSAVIQVNPTEQDQSWLQKVLFQQQLSMNKDQNSSKNNKMKYDYLNKNENLYDFTKKIQSQSLIKKNNFNPQRKNSQCLQGKNYLRYHKYSIQEPQYEFPKTNKQSCSPYKRQPTSQNEKIPKQTSKINHLNIRACQNNQIDEDRLKQIQQKIKNYSYKSNYELDKIKVDQRVLKSMSLNCNIIPNTYKTLNENTKIKQNLKPSHRVTPTFNQKEMIHLQIIRGHFQSVFSHLTNQKEMSCYNSDLSKITQDLKYLLGPIFGQLKIKKKLISKQDFVQRALQLVKNYQFQQINQLLKNNFLQRKQIDVKQYQSQKKNRTISSYNRDKENYLNTQKDKYKSNQNYHKNSIIQMDQRKHKFSLNMLKDQKSFKQDNIVEYIQNASPKKQQTLRKGPSKSPYMKVIDMSQSRIQVKDQRNKNHEQKFNTLNKLTKFDQEDDLKVWSQKLQKDQDLSILQKLQSKFATHFNHNRKFECQNLDQLSFDELIRYS